MAATSAAMLMTFATSSSRTRRVSSQRGDTALMLPARPLPVTQPIRAQIDWMAIINGRQISTGHSMLSPYWAPTWE
jgi:hypothetical protein